MSQRHRAMRVAESAMNDRSVRRTAAQQMLVPVLRHPAGAREVRFPCPPCAPGLADCIDLKHDLGDLPPIGSVRLRVEQAEIGDEMLLVIGRENFL